MLNWVGDGLLRLAHASRANTLFGSRRNIAQHYDAGNDMYRLFLDPSMTYSSAVFRHTGESAICLSMSLSSQRVPLAFFDTACSLQSHTEPSCLVEDVWSNRRVLLSNGFHPSPLGMKLAASVTPRVHCLPLNFKATCFPSWRC